MTSFGLVCIHSYNVYRNNEDSFVDNLMLTVYNLPTFRLDAPVILRAKMKRGAKMMAIYRRGS